MSTSVATAPTIYELKIERFRGIPALCWQPGKGVNVILGGGDAGKSTILEALGLLLSPTNTTTLSTTDFYNRDDKAGFVIEGVFALPASTGISQQTRLVLPWHWTGTEAVVPDIEAESATKGEPVYRLRVRAGEELEPIYEIVHPDDTTDILSVALRRSIGLVKLGGDDRNDRDLRLVHGSALDRLLSDKGLRSRLVSNLADTDVTASLQGESKALLTQLDSAFRDRKLPADLNLAITGSHGLSISSLIGLTAKRKSIQLPLASWGAGTRRLAALAIAQYNQGANPITLVDEFERGLESYRQGILMEELLAGGSQVFLTTHSAAAIASAATASIWYVDHDGKIGLLDAKATSQYRGKDPEAFLSRLTIVVEGATEKGFVLRLLEIALRAPPKRYGIHVSDADGHQTALGLLAALAKAGLRFGGFVDDEGGLHPEGWQRVRNVAGKLLFRWEKGCLEENVIGAMAVEKLEALLIDPAGEKVGRRLRTLVDRLGIEERTFEAIKAAAGEGLQALVVQAASGSVPEGKEDDKNTYKAHARDWFKNLRGGGELAQKMFDLGAWNSLKVKLLPFCNAVRTMAGLPEIEDLPA